MIASFGKKKLLALLFFGLWLVLLIYLVLWLSALPLVVVGRIWSVLVTLPRHLLYSIFQTVITELMTDYISFPLGLLGPLWYI